jgi:hypothetical protein
VIAWGQCIDDVPFSFSPARTATTPRYDSAFGSPVARVQGLGYLQELVARLAHTPITTHNSSTNATLHTPETFPLGHALYVDATHEVVVLNGGYHNMQYHTLGNS